MISGGRKHLPQILCSILNKKEKEKGIYGDSVAPYIS
jgi:hypothetical protein